MVVHREDNFELASSLFDHGVVNGLERAGEEELETIDQGFSSGSDPLGRPWVPLAPETIRRKGNDQILVDSGRMRESFGMSIDRDRQEVKIGSSSNILPYHEFGTETIPRRSILRPAAIDLEQNVLRSALVREINRALAALPGGSRF